MIAVKRDSTTIAEYAYNPHGQRIKKTVNGITTWYFYNGNGLAAEYSSTGQLIKEYHFHPQKTWMTDPLFQRTAGGELYYYHNDHLGTPQQMLDEAGNVVWSAQYSTFGKAHITIDTVENNLRFPGQYFDGETELHHNYFRDYDSALGRYIQSDPIGLRGGINTYAYVEGNPLIKIDFWGLQSNNSWNSFQNAFSGSGLSSSQLASLYHQNNLNNWANTGNHNWTPGFPRSPVVSGVGGIVDLVNSSVSNFCFYRALQIQNSINQAIQDASNQSPSCGDTYWQVAIQIASPTGCIQSHTLSIGIDQSVWSPIAVSPVNRAPWSVYRGRH